MSAMQKTAWYNLVVVAVTLALVLVLYPFLGFRAMGGLACLGALGLTPILFRKRSNEVFLDERDRHIQSRAWLLAYVLFWLAFVIVAVVGSALVYGQDGAVPVTVVQTSVAWAMMLVTAVASMAVLVQYGRTEDASQ